MDAIGTVDLSGFSDEVLRLTAQPWTIELKQYPDGSYFARAVELEGCMTEAETAGDAINHVQETIAMWIDVALEHGDPIPMPGDDKATRRSV